MEIDKAVADSGDKRLQAKYKQSVYVIQRTLALYSFEEVAFSFNGGKDSTVLLHLLRAGYASIEATEHGGKEHVCSESKHPIRTIYFESPGAFPEINAFTYETAKTYDLQMEIIRLDFKSGLEALLKEKPVKAIFLGTRIGDPNAVGQEQFSPSSAGWPPFMRVNPILDWSYRDVWAFLLACKVPYCKLYDQGYTSIGSIHDTVPNGLLCIENSSGDKEKFRPAYLLPDGRLERAGRMKRMSFRSRDTAVAVSNGMNDVVSCENSIFAASIIAVGDEIVWGAVEDQIGPSLSQKLHSIGWAVTHRAVVPNDIDAIAEEIEHRIQVNDMVFIFGGVGPIHSDVTLAGIAKAFGVRLAPDEEFEEYLRQFIGEDCSGDHNEMARLPEGITELLHHDELPVPLIKCQNVIVLSATTLPELDLQWNCLLELRKDKDLLQVKPPYVSKFFRTTVPEVEIAEPLSRINSEFPDLSIGCYRESRIAFHVKMHQRNQPTVVVTFVGKNSLRVQSAVDKLCSVFPKGTFSEVKCG
eukprot:Gb_39454 [translate_table: standard]